MNKITGLNNPSMGKSNRSGLEKINNYFKPSESIEDLKQTQSKVDLSPNSLDLTTVFPKLTYKTNIPEEGKQIHEGI